MTTLLQRFLMTSLLVILSGVFVPGAPDALAQDRDTGRHKPVVEEPEVVEEAGEEDTPPREALPLKWHVGVNFGIQGASDLFRVETLDGGAMGWESIGSGGFNASRFTATFDQDFSLGLFLQKDVGDMVALRADLGISRADVAAEALSGQIGVLYLYDRIDMFNVGLGAEFRLTRAPSHPFAGVAFLLNRMSPTRFDELAQTNLGGRISLGYLQRLMPEIGLRVEGRLGMTTLDVDEFRPPAELTTDPEIDYDPESSLRTFEILLGIQASFGG